jgi:hypothetical protein
MTVPYADALNLATNVKWIAVIPFYQIDEELSSGDVAFNLYTFNLPDMSIGSTEVNYNGYPIEIPTNVKAGDKTVTFEYLMSSDWHQYKLLWGWANKIVNQQGAGRPEDNKKNGSFMVPIRFMALSEFKKPLFSIIYHDCWIKDFGAISLDYQDGDASVVTHNFTCSYSYFEFEDISKA